MKLSVSLFVAVVLGLLGSPAVAQTYPDRAIRLIAPNPPGGLGDLLLRTFGDYVAAKTGQPAVIENRAGANGNGAGYTIPNKFKEAIAGDGRTIIVKVKTMWDYVTETFGTFTWGMSKNPGTPVTIPVKKGIIVYHKAFSDATGHFDLWNGTGFVGPGKLSDVTDGFDVAMWYWN